MISLNTTGWLVGTLMVLTGCRIFNRFLALRPELKPHLLPRDARWYGRVCDHFFYFTLAPILTVGGVLRLRQERKSLERIRHAELDYDAQAARIDELRSRYIRAMQIDPVLIGDR